MSLPIRPFIAPFTSAELNFAPGSLQYQPMFIVPLRPPEIQSASVLLDVQGTADLTKITFNGKLQKPAPGRADFAGPGDLVYLVGSREAALALDPWFVPVDSAIVGIVDDVDNRERKP